MCLVTVDKKTKKYKRKIGYKIFYVSDGKISAACFHYHPYKLNKWYTATKGEIKASSKDKETYYKQGFHVCMKSPIALIGDNSAYACYKVQYSTIVASGTENNYLGPIVIARRMKILSKVENAIHKTRTATRPSNR